MSNPTTNARTHTLVQITDTHLVPDGELLYTAVDPAANLQRAVDSIPDHAEQLDAILLTGDLANDGVAAAYRRLRSIMDDASDRLGVPVYYGMGNHDKREAFRAVLLDGDTRSSTPAAGNGDAGPGGEQMGAPVDYVIDVNGLRVVMIDSTAPPHHYGELTGDQLAWLNAVLAEPAESGTLVTIHHPPFPRRDYGGDAEMMSKAGFDDISGLADAVRDTDVMMVLSGHYHEPLAGRIGGVPVWAGPSSAMAHEIGTDPDVFRIVAGSAITVIDVFEDRTAVARAINCLERPALYEMSMDSLRHYIDQAH